MTSTASSHTPTRDRVDVLLRSFLSPGLAARVSADVPRGGGELAAAVARLRELVTADDESLVVALAEAGVGAAAAAALVGVSVRDAHEWLDLDLDPAVSDAVPTPPRGLWAARLVVRAIWVVLALAVVVTLVQSRGGLRPCDEPICVDAVVLLLEDGSEVAAGDAGTYDSDEVVGVRFEHRGSQVFEGDVSWTADGEELFVSGVTARGDGSFVVPWPGAVLPFGVHVVRLEGAPSAASVTFSVQPGD